MIVNKLSPLLPQESTKNSVENIHTDVGMLRVNKRSTKAIMSTTTTTKDMAILMIMRITTTTTTITNLPKIY